METSAAYEAQSGQVLRVQNRPSNVHDGKAAGRFLRELLAQLTATLGAGYGREFRMDGAFCRRDVLTLLERVGAEYAIKMPFYPWLGLKARVQATREWTSVTAAVSRAEHWLEPTQKDEVARQPARVPPALSLKLHAEPTDMPPREVPPWIGDGRMPFVSLEPRCS